MLIAAASCVLVRGGPAGLEVLLMRRQARGSWADALVFPGGKVEAGEGPLEAAARELLEEAGVVLGQAAPPPGLRQRLIAGEKLAEPLPTAGLVPWARWQTPAVEPRRFDAFFYVAALPEGAEAESHDHEHVEHRWLGPQAALEAARAGELRLPPPQLRTLWELLPHATPQAVLTAGAARAPHVLPLMPRPLQEGERLHLVFPWDPAYAGIAAEGQPWPAGHPLGEGPSRVTLEAGFWRL